MVTYDEKRSSTASSILSKKSNPLAALEKRLTTWDLNLPENPEKDWNRYNKEIDDDVSTLKARSSISSLESLGKGDTEEKEDSPYEEVRAAVPNYDSLVPANTLRAWVIGLLLSFFGAAVNTIFSLRNPVIGIGVIVAQVSSPSIS